MKKIALSIYTCFCCLALFGQEAQKTAILPTSNEVVAPVAGEFQNAEMIMSFVMGEAAVGSISNEENEEGITILQGFQHPSIVLLETAIEEIYIESIRIYPNPATEQVYLDFPSEVLPNVHYSIIDISGKALTNGSVRSNEQIDIGHFTTGVYLLSLQTKDGEKIGTYQLQKSE